MVVAVAPMVVLLPMVGVPIHRRGRSDEQTARLKIDAPGEGVAARGQVQDAVAVLMIPAPAPVMELVMSKVGASQKYPDR